MLARLVVNGFEISLRDVSPPPSVRRMQTPPSHLHRSQYLAQEYHPPLVSTVASQSFPSLVTTLTFLPLLLSPSFKSPSRAFAHSNVSASCPLVHSAEKAVPLLHASLLVLVVVTAHVAPALLLLRLLLLLLSAHPPPLAITPLPYSFRFARMSATLLSTSSPFSHPPLLPERSDVQM